MGINELKICLLCSENINLKTDNYCKLTDYKLGAFFMKRFYHTICFNNKLQGSTEQQKLRKSVWAMLGKTNKLLNRELGEKEVVEI